MPKPGGQSCCGLSTPLWPLCTHLGWGHSPFPQASETSVSDRCLVGLLRTRSSLEPPQALDSGVWGPFPPSSTDIILYTEPATPSGGGRLCPELPPDKGPHLLGAGAEVEQAWVPAAWRLVGWETHPSGASSLWGKPLSLFYWKRNVLLSFKNNSLLK